MKHNRKRSSLAQTRSCECDHACHREPILGPAVRSPKGNPGHRYRTRFTELFLTSTIYGTLCKNCTVDCAWEELLT